MGPWRHAAQELNGEALGVALSECEGLCGWIEHLQRPHGPPPAPSLNPFGKASPDRASPSAPAHCPTDRGRTSSPARPARREADARRNDEVDAGFLQPVGQRPPRRPCRAPRRNAAPARRGRRPGCCGRAGASPDRDGRRSDGRRNRNRPTPSALRPSRAAEQPAVESARRVEIVDRKGEMEGRQRHIPSSSRARPDCKIAALRTMCGGVKFLFFSFLAGLVAACGFQPLGLWPLTIAGVRLPCCGWSGRRRGLRTALARGWWFGVGHFTSGLNWIATAFTYQAAMPAWLGWVAVVLLSLYLAVYPAMAAGLAWRYGRARPASLWSLALRRGLDRHRMASRRPVHRLRLEPARGRPAARRRGVAGLGALRSAPMAFPALALLAAGALLLLLGRRVASRRGLLAAPDPARRLAAVPGRSPARARPARNRLRIVQPNIGQQEKWQEGFDRRPRRSSAGSQRRAARDRRVSCSGPRPRSPSRSRTASPIRSIEAESAALRSEVGGDARPGRPAADRRRHLALGQRSRRDQRDQQRLRDRSRAAASSAATTRPISSPMANICRRGPCSRRSACRASRRATSISIPGPGPRTLDLPLVGKVGFQLCYEIIFSGEVVDRGEPARLPLQSVQRCLVRRLGPAPASRPGAAAGARGRAAGAARDADRHLGGDRCRRAAARTACRWRSAGRDRRAACRRPSRRRLFARFGNVLPLLFALLLAALAIAVRRKAR